VRIAACIAVFALLATLGVAQAGVEDGEHAFQRRDFRSALTILAPLAEAGDATAQYYVGAMYFAGLGVVKDQAKGVELVTRAADQGSARAKAFLGALYLQGRGVEKDEAKGGALIREAADAGIASAQLNMGVLLERGRGGFAKDEATAFLWLKAAADQHYVRSYALVGSAYDRGLGVERDPAQAVAWWQKGAEAGDRASRYHLARAYLEGKGGLGRDVKAAIELLAQSANQRFAPAQAMLGAVYEKGIGVPVDYVLAHMWFNLARAQGLTAARKKMDALEEKMTPEQIADAQRRAREWRPQIVASMSASARKISGSGFVVSPEGHVVTNHHVVEGCRSITVSPGDAAAEVIESDPRNDLALLRRVGAVTSVASVRTGASVRPGDDVVVVGYPLRGVLGASPVVTTGTVSALGGLANDASKLQIAAPIQQGSSGGPLLDRHGLVVGVIQSKINALRIAAATGDIPQNVNFAINAATLTSFLEASGVAFRAESPRGALRPAADVGEAAAAFTVAVECAR
jgi:uncharacterized protein